MKPAAARFWLRSLVWICHVSLIVAFVLWILALQPPQPWPGIVLAVLIAPLLIAAGGLYRDQRYTYQWLSLVLVIYSGVGIVEVIASQRSTSAAVVVVLATGAELLIVLSLIRNAPSTRRE